MDAAVRSGSRDLLPSRKLDKKMFRTDTIQDGLSRTAKMLLDTGEAATLEDAYKILSNYVLSVRVGADIAESATLQAALLTTVNTARRCFLGGVEVTGCPDADLLTPLSGRRTLKEAIVDLRGRVVNTVVTTHPEIVFGNAAASTSSEFAVRATFNGWVGGVAPVKDAIRLAESQEFSPAGVLAGSLAVSEAFQFVRGKNPAAGRRSVGLSLWQPDAEEDWATIRETGLDLEILPSRLWLIGLGHLGQAYLWTLGMLPYANPEEVVLVLQDTDRLTIANDSTSPLTQVDLVGRYKTRAMAEWCEARGFQTRIVERLFTDDFRVAGEEPMIGLCGVDNSLARAALEDVGFLRVIEAGLGRGAEEYLAFQIHTFLGAKLARNIWREPSSEQVAVPSVPAYQDLESRGLDKCGLTMLANRSVGASFVGTFTSTLVIAEVLRLLAGGPAYDVIDGTLRQPQSTQAIAKIRELPVINPGTTPAMPTLRQTAILVPETENVLVEV